MGDGFMKIVKKSTQSKQSKTLSMEITLLMLESFHEREKHYPMTKPPDMFENNFRNLSPR